MRPCPVQFATLATDAGSTWNAQPLRCIVAYASIRMLIISLFWCDASSTISMVYAVDNSVHNSLGAAIEGRPITCGKSSRKSTASRISSERARRCRRFIISLPSSDTDSTILIQGESRTAKSWSLARPALMRQHQPFVAINCSALPENLLESELFGHKKGSFTGAVKNRDWLV